MTVSLQALTSALKTHTEATDQSGESWMHWIGRVTPVVDTFLQLKQVAEQAATAKRDFDAAYEGAQQGIPALPSALPSTSFITDWANAAHQQARQILDDEEKAQKAAEAAAKAFQSAVQSMADSLSGADLAKKVKELNAAIAELGGVSNLTQPELQRLTKQAEDLWKQGALLSPSIIQATHAFDALLVPVKLGTDGLKDFGTHISSLLVTDAQLEESIGSLDSKIKIGFGGVGNIGFKVSSGFGEAVKGLEAQQKAAKEAAAQIERDVQEMARAFDQLGSAIGGNLGAAISDFGHLITAVDGAYRAFQQLGQAKTFIAGLSAGLSGVVGVISAAIGPVESLFNHFFGSAGRDAVTQFADSMGGFDALHQKLDLLGADGERLWINLTQGVGRNDPQQAQAAIDAVTKALDAQKTAEDALNQSQNSQIGDLISKIQSFGGSIDPALDSYIQKLKDAGKLTGENADALKALEGDGKPSFDDLTKLQQKYNLTAAQMGPSFQTQQIDANFQTIIDDMDELTRGGADVTAALFTVGKDGSQSLSGLGTAVQGDIEDAIKAGIDIPANLKPAAAALIAQGDLVDINGNKIKDTNQLTFGATMQTTLDTLNKTLDLLIQKMTGPGQNSLTSAIDAIPKHVDITFTASTRGTWPSADGGMVSAAAMGGIVTRGRVIPFPTAASYYDRGGFVPHGSDTVPAMLTPGEVVLNAAQQRALAGQMGGGDIVIHHQTILDGRVIDERIDRVTRRSAATGGLRTRAAHGRSY